MCPTSGCESVLNSDYSQLFGLPLSLYGFLAYAGVGAAALAASSRQSQQQHVPSQLNVALMTGSTLLASCSAILM